MNSDSSVHSSNGIIHTLVAPYHPSSDIMDKQEDSSRHSSLQCKREELEDTESIFTTLSNNTTPQNR